MDRYTELEDAVVDLKEARLSVPRMYQFVLYLVVVSYYFFILPGVKGQPPRDPNYALLDVFLVAIINIVILAMGLQAGSVFRSRATKDFKDVDAMFSEISQVKTRYYMSDFSHRVY